MRQFFRQIENITLDSPISAEVYFRGASATGLVEKYFGDEQPAVMLFINGEPSMAYLLENGRSRSMSLGEFSSLEDPNPHVINLPDVAGRLALLALESQAESGFSIENEENWKKHLDRWKQDRWSGLVEIKSNTLHGFVFFWQGEPQKSDTIFSMPQGFSGNFPALNDQDVSAWVAVTYSHHASAHAYQYAVLRQGFMHWSREILGHYQEMVGLKLLQMMGRELNRQILPWRWNILLEEKDVFDLHFFPYLMDAAHAYRALFMTMGTQMNFVIGNNLTQRLLSDTFEQLHPDERVALQSQRLIPAAFSE